MLPVFLFSVARRGHCPDGFHLFAAVGLAHEVVVEGVFALLVFRGPDDGLGAVGEVAATEVGRRIGFLPSYVIEKLEAELLHGVADVVNDVVRAADPDGAVRLEDTLAATEPFEIEFVVEFRPARFVPITLVHLHHLPGVTGDAAVGEKIRRVGKDAVEAALGIFLGNGVEQFEAVAVIEADEGRFRTVSEAGWGRSAVLRSGALGFGLGVSRVGDRRSNHAIVTKFKVRGRNRRGVGKVGGIARHFGA